MDLQIIQSKIYEIRGCILPHDYDKMLRLIAQMEEKGEDSEQAQIEAFYAMKSAK